MGDIRAPYHLNNVLKPNFFFSLCVDSQWVMSKLNVIIPGPLHSLNKDCIDWGPQRLVAFGSHSCVFVLEPTDMKRVQNLDRHLKPVTKVKWSHNLGHIGEGLEYNLLLASGDDGGVIFVWRVAQGSVLTTLVPGLYL